MAVAVAAVLLMLALMRLKGKLVGCRASRTGLRTGLASGLASELLCSVASRPAREVQEDVSNLLWPSTCLPRPPTAFHTVREDVFMAAPSDCL